MTSLMNNPSYHRRKKIRPKQISRPRKRSGSCKAWKKVWKGKEEKKLFLKFDPSFCRFQNFCFKDKNKNFVFFPLRHFVFLFSPSLPPSEKTNWDLRFYLHQWFSWHSKHDDGKWRFGWKFSRFQLLIHFLGWCGVDWSNT